MDNLERTYLSTLPVEDNSSIIYWDTATLNQVDSEIIRHTYRTTCDHYKAIYKALVCHPESPYTKQASGSDAPISEEEFLWAFTSVSARSLVMNNTNVTEMNDPKSVMMMMPLLDMVNHSSDPNCVILPYHDKTSDHSYVILQSIKPIAKGDQITISYGSDLANTHLIQKYGFVMPENPVKKLITNLPFHDYETIAYEETPLKMEVSQKYGIPYSQNGIHNAVFYSQKFPQEVLRQIRLSFLTSRQLIENGGANYVNERDFSSEVDPENERMAHDFMIESFERILNNLKSREHYADKLSTAPQVGSISDFNQMNLTVLQLDEHDLLSKNLEFLYKTRSEHLSKF